MPSKLTLLVILLSFPAYLYLSINQYLSTLWIIVYFILWLYVIVIFGIRKLKKINSHRKDYIMNLNGFLNEFRPDKNDYLLMAHKAELSALKAIKDNRLDDAWRAYHKQKNHYLHHAKRSAFTYEQSIALDASVSEGLANILRIENRVYDALTHIIWWVAATNRGGNTKKQHQKLRAYFNRCKFPKEITFEMLSKLIFEVSQTLEFERIQQELTKWKTVEG